MSTSVLAPSGFEVSSNTASAEDMMSVLAEPKKDRSPRVIMDKGKLVDAPAEKEADPLTEHAREMGKKGGEAAAAKRAAEAAAAKKAEAGKAAKPDAEEADDAEGDGKPVTNAEARHDTKARIQQLAAQKKEAEERATAEKRRSDSLEQRLADLERRAPPAPQASTDRQPAPAERATKPAEGAPRREDFEDYDQYLDARSAHQVKTLLAEERQRETQEREAAQHRQETGKRIHAFAERLSGVKAGDAEHQPKLAAFMESLAPELQNLRTSFELTADEEPGPMNGIADLVFESEHARELLLHLSSNPSELQRLASAATPLILIREMAKLEARLERADAATAGTSSTREPSRASQPVRPVTATPATAEPDLSRVDFDTHMKAKGQKGKR